MTKLLLACRCGHLIPCNHHRVTKHPESIVSDLFFHPIRYLKTKLNLIVEKLNKCILKIVVSNLFLTRQHPVWYINSKDPKTSCLHEIEIQFNMLDIKEIMRCMDVFLIIKITVYILFNPCAKATQYACARLVAH